MPELPEVETVARSLRPHLVGRTVGKLETSGLALRAPVDKKRIAAACVGARVEGVRRIGKYLLVDLSRGDVLLAHLGMSGHFEVAGDDEPRAPHTHAVFFLDGGGQLRYVDARRFGVLRAYREKEIAGSPELSILGPDPLSDDFTVGYLESEMSRSRSDVKRFLLDQKKIAGLGNIYVSEALFAAKISPRRRCDRVKKPLVADLHRAIREILSASVARRGTTFRDYVDAEGARGGNQHHLAVYGREGEPCPSCKTAIRRLVQGARSTFYCARCQRG
jgi:formamidopyrimidine-DNA glycosylase